MRTPEQVKWDFVQQWLGKAQQDLRAAKVLLSGELEDFDPVGFHAQQAAEKLIKAVLVRHQIEFPKTHDLARLRKLLAQVDRALAGSLAPLDALTPFGVEFRYPGSAQIVTHDQGSQLLQLAEDLRETVLAHLAPYLRAGRP